MSLSAAEPVSDEAGFTVLETIVVLAVCSIALFLFWALAMRIGFSFSRSGGAGAASLKAATLDRALRSLCQRVEPPFCAALPADAFSDGNAVLPYLDGEPDSILRIESSSTPGSASRSVVLTAGKTKIALDGFDSFEMEPLAAEGGRTAGALARFSCGGGEYECRALFSSWSLSGGYGE